MTRRKNHISVNTQEEAESRLLATGSAPLWACRELLDLAFLPAANEIAKALHKQLHKLENDKGDESLNRLYLVIHAASLLLAERRMPTGL